MQFKVEQLEIPAGSQLLIHDVDWETFDKWLDDTMETRRLPRINYSQGWLELMVPGIEHENDKRIIGNLVEALLEAMDIEFCAAGSTTLRSSKTQKAVEADDCFYIQHEKAVRGKKAIHLDFDPPPDLAIEIDITSRTHFDNYEKLGVPELWRFNGKELTILLLENGNYVESEISRQFPKLPIKQIIPDYLEKSKQDGRNKTMKAFRQWLAINLSHSLILKKL
jgi:Uma2 family endonuclease